MRRIMRTRMVSIPYEAGQRTKHSKHMQGLAADIVVVSIPYEAGQRTKHGVILEDSAKRESLFQSPTKRGNELNSRLNRDGRACV